jgi:hypothetical protein
VSEGKDPQLYPEETVDRLEAGVLGEGGPGTDEAPDETASDDDRVPIHEQDKDVEDLPGGAGEQGGSASEPAD